MHYHHYMLTTLVRMRCIVSILHSVDAYRSVCHRHQYWFTYTPFTRYNRLSNRLSNRFDNRLYTRYSRYDTAGCQTGLKPVECLYTQYNRLSNRFDSRFDNRLYRVNGALATTTITPICSAKCIGAYVGIKSL